MTDNTDKIVQKVTTANAMLDVHTADMPVSVSAIESLTFDAVCSYKRGEKKEARGKIDAAINILTQRIEGLETGKRKLESVRLLVET